MSKSAGSLFGLAYGDAMGAPAEFKSIEQINRMYGPEGPLTLPMSGSVSHVTDDTQMALAVADALAATLDGGNALIPDRFEPRVRDRFGQWWRSPDNDRAPGNTCMQACEAMASGTPWLQATIIGSKGCGANMRVTPLALPSSLDLDDRCGAAQLQAAMTHGHPTGVAASELTMAATLLALTEPLACRPRYAVGRTTIGRFTTSDGWAIYGRARTPRRRRIGSHAAGTNAWRPWTASTRRCRRPTVTPTRAWPPAPGGSPRKRWPPRSTASCYTPTIRWPRCLVPR